MLDIKFVRENPEFVAQGVQKKNSKVDIDKMLILDSEKRDLVTKVEQLKKYRNEVSKKVGVLKREKKPCDDIMAEMKKIGEDIKEIDLKIKNLTSEVDNILVWIPNLPHESAPVGKDETANRFLKEFGEKRSFDFKPKTHCELAESLDIIDFNRATKISGSGFILFKGKGALLERALINFMLDVHSEEHGFTEVFPPFIVNSACMFGTGQLPKMEEDMYKIDSEEMYLIPTAEVPVTNIHRDEILDEDALPIRYVAYTPCYRREAGSYGKDTRGMIRVHQFDKVEMVKFVLPESSYDELDKLVVNAEKILQLLGLPYRVLELCSGDMSFAAAKCFDLEAWSPGQDSYLEVSSCSNFEDFQARRMNIRYRDKSSGKLRFVHTLNGSGLALARIVVAIIENYQTAEGKIEVPEALRPYMRGLDFIE